MKSKRVVWVVELDGEPVPGATQHSYAAARQCVYQNRWLDRCLYGEKPRMYRIVRYGPAMARGRAPVRK